MPIDRLHDASGITGIAKWVKHHFVQWLKASGGDQRLVAMYGFNMRRSALQ